MEELGMKLDCVKIKTNKYFLSAFVLYFFQVNYLLVHSLIKLIN